MNSTSIALIVAFTLATSATATAQDPKKPDVVTGAMLEVDKRYVFTLAEGSRLSDFSGVARVLTPVRDGWVRIEYQPGAPGMGTVLPTKTQLWLNLAHVVTIQNASAKGSK